ncbi:hypothetical protein [Pantoea allii]|uniref:hypothetical protein n=1 Tax=Pantoea allii TaxID=574096 RepID=UPI000A23D96F|nr:hypothetical protein [Pantoea allii]MBW1254683.1 hypothetical protein [Pantoea allii]MBW1264104.1 hypothetical protein [Pantoea allii]MBW1286061.1 hypothetical protein [Pantoea allii]ORM82332.1 hypothetical protein HA38_21165 [Pantoea allii]PBK01168.1 hypothetical protein CMR03_06215 [Pantoea allii]
MANSDSSTTANIENSGFQPVVETEIAMLLKSPHSAFLDLFQTLGVCQRYTKALMGNHDIVKRMALCGRLLTGLELLKYLLKQPLPEHLIKRLTVKQGPLANNNQPLCSDSESLCEYCEALVITILNQQTSEDRQQQLIVLLFELVNLLTEDLKTPRFTRSYTGLVMINGEAVPGTH